MNLLQTLAEDRALAVVRAPRIDDPAALVSALVAGGIRTVELTFTTPGVTELVAAGAEVPDALVGCGTVLTADQAAQAVAAGAAFLVTPGLGPEPAEIVATAHEAGAAVMLGAMTPSEVLTAVALGSDVVKIFPARTVGPRHLADLHGPLPEVPLVPSGGIDETNAADYLRAGALAVTAGTSVVGPDDVTAGRWPEITAKATAFRVACTTEEES